MQDKLTFPPLSDESMQQNLLLSIFADILIRLTYKILDAN